jgi:hypothetical protein
MRVPDPIEQGESRMERWAEENMRGDEFRCECGKWFPLDEGVPSSQDPYSQPICGDCAGLSDNQTGK